MKNGKRLSESCVTDASNLFEATIRSTTITKGTCGNFLRKVSLKMCSCGHGITRKTTPQYLWAKMVPSNVQ